ncbi:hypothetical protein [Aeromonas veronii]|uniref:hypothetical protein n=1 Tax=Aeromonas veronii TaxID=654 RepID=UPI003B9E8F0D
MNPLRLVKWFFYFVFGCIFLAMVTMMAGNYVQAAEWTPASKPSTWGQCFVGSNLVLHSSYVTIEQCVKAATTYQDNPSRIASAVLPINTAQNGQTNIICTNTPYANFNCGQFRNVYLSQAPFTCPPDGKPDFTFGPKVTNNGTVCEKKPLQCLLGSVKDTNVITGKEFCRPLCEGIAGNTYGSTQEPVSYFSSTFGSVKITCYGQCSVKSVGGAFNPTGNPNIWMGVIQFTGENCPIQTNGNVDDSSTAGVDTPVTPPDSSAATNNAQNQLQNAASSAVSNPTSGATGTATLNTVVDKIAETSNKEIKASSEQNAAIGKVIQQTGKDIQTSIKEAQLSASQGSAGAGLGQIQTANAIKDGNAQIGTKLDAIKDAIEKKDEGNTKPLPPGITKVQTDAGTVYTNRNDWGSRNYNTVLQQHVTALGLLPLFQSIGGFFQIRTSAANCPQFTIGVPDIGGYGGGQITFDAFCNADLARIFAIIALCIKLAGMYVGFRIAVLD